MMWTDLCAETEDIPVTDLEDNVNRVSITVLANFKLTLVKKLNLVVPGKGSEVTHYIENFLFQYLGSDQTNIVLCGYCCWAKSMGRRFGENFKNTKVLIFDGNPIAMLKASMDNFDNTSDTEIVSDADVIIMLSHFNQE